MNRIRPLSFGVLCLFFLVLTTIWFAPLDTRKLAKADEGRYAEIAREMVVSGDWVTPRLNGFKYFDKPPLQYWATATAYTVFGQHDWTARLWTALTGFFGILFAAFSAHKLWGGSAGLYTGAILSSSLLYGLMGHMNTLDMGVSVFLASAVFALVLAQRDAASRIETRNWMWVGWLFLGLAVLSKGLIGLVLPAATLVLYSLTQRDFSIWKKLHLVSGMALLLAVTAPWFIAVSKSNPEFAHFFFIHEHFQRFLTKEHGRYQPMWYFIPILLAGVMPWVTAFITTIGDVLRREPARFQPRRFLLLWCVVVFGFFSVSGSKLPSYILPLFPALAGLIGLHLSKTAPRNLRWHSLPFFIIGIAAMALAPQATRFAGPDVPLALYQAYVPWLIAAGGALALTSLIAFLYARNERRCAAILSLSIGGLLCGQLILSGHESLAPANSAWGIAQIARSQLKPETQFFSVNTYEQTLQPYLGRTTTMVIYKDELSFGIQQEPQKFLPDYTSFEKAWQQAPSAMALMPTGTYAHFQAKHFPMRVIAQDTRRIIVAKPETPGKKTP